MEKKVSILTAGIVSMAFFSAPMSVFAYLSPDQVFNNSTSLHESAPDPRTEPVTRRVAPDVVTAQQQYAASSRAAAQSTLTSIQAEPVDTYVPAPASSRGLFDENTQYEQRQARLAAKKSTGPTIVIAGNGDVIDGNGNVLHSGAPLVTSTGPESILAILVMLLAAVTTFAFVQIRARRMNCTA